MICDGFPTADKVRRISDDPQHLRDPRLTASAGSLVAVSDRRKKYPDRWGQTHSPTDPMKTRFPAVKSLPFAFLAWLLSFAPFAAAADWPGWRGPRGDGSSDETGVPLRWSSTENIAWTTPLPGKGHSSPIVFGDRVFITTCLEQAQQHVLLCLDRLTGKVLWQQSAPAKLQSPIHKLNSHASSTPATDGKLVWVSFLDHPDMTIIGYDVTDGKQVWKTVPGVMLSKHGYCSSVVPYQDTIIINGDQDAQGFIVALDQATGRERWRTDRPNRTRSYCPPTLIEVQGRKQLVLSGSLCVAAYNPDTGALIWIIDGPTEQFVSSPIHLADVVFMTYGFPKRGICAIDPGGTGNVTATHVVFNL